MTSIFFSTQYYFRGRLNVKSTWYSYFGQNASALRFSYRTLQTARKTGSSDVTKSGIPGICSGFCVRQGSLRSTNAQSAGIIFQSPTWIFVQGKDLVLVRIHSKMLRKESTTWKNISNFATFLTNYMQLYFVFCAA